ncbi:MAG TPA: restriction endonuclease [Thermoanaerobaculia bacterium]|nr:restriction endonuclease [Thermoanaerobaculia bacterium]
MIITEADISELEQFVDGLRQGKVARDPQFFTNRPHLVLASGFDEFSAYEAGVDDIESIMFGYGFDVNSDVGNEDFELMRSLLGREFESFYRDESSGAWYWLQSVFPTHLHFFGPTDFNRFEWFGQIIDKLHDLLRSPASSSNALWLSGLWTPALRMQTRVELRNSVDRILRSIFAQNEELAAISPRNLEELVAELLRAKGLDIHLTPYSKDGGRDIIARGELVPGEPMVIAVEVKRKPVVGLHDLQRALYANSDFPALMIATSGRFSAGVISEKRKEGNRLRLLLKDGIALSQWIEAYGTRRGWLR